jgi:hypothetical protein
VDICKTDFKQLQTLELCGGGNTDAGVRNIKDLTSLTSLNLSQNMRLTDNALQYLSGKLNAFYLGISGKRSLDHFSTILNAWVGGMVGNAEMKNLVFLNLANSRVTNGTLMSWMNFFSFKFWIVHALLLICS